MKSVALAITLVALAAPANADEISLTINSALGLKAALAELSAGSPTIIKDGEKQTVTMQPFNLSPAVRAALAKDSIRIDAVMEQPMKELRALGQRLCPNDKCDEESRIERDKQSESIGNRQIKLDLIVFTESELNLEKNPGISPRLLGMFAPILPFLNSVK